MTGKELIVYILQNDLENEVIFRTTVLSDLQVKKS